MKRNGVGLLVALVGVLLLVNCPAKAGIISLNLSEVPEGPSDYDVYVCNWTEMVTTAGDGESWIIRAAEDIQDLHFGTWDTDDYIVMGDMGSIFTQYSFTCSFDELGGPPTIDPAEWKPHWQTLDVYDGTGLLEGHYYEISMDKDPFLGIPDNQVRQNVFLHPTPEPGTFLLIGLGGLCLLRKRSI